MTQEETIKQLESLYDYCENMRSSDNDFAVWERDCEAIKIALSALRPITREQVEKVWRSEWEGVPRLGVYYMACSKCGFDPGMIFYSSDFCPNCGAPMTDKAVDMVMERLEVLKDADD